MSVLLLAPRTTGVRKGEAAMDAWSIAHVLSGAALRAFRVPTAWAITILVAFEVLEAGLRRAHTKDGAGLFEYESWPNILADIVLGAGGYLLGRLARSPTL